MRSYVIIGAGSKATHLADLFHLWTELIQFYDHPYHIGEEKRGIPVSHMLQAKKLRVISAVGDTRHKRQLIYELMKDKEKDSLEIEWDKLSHKTTIHVNPQHIGYDYVAREYCTIGSQAHIGNHVSIGPHSNISHGSIIEDYVTICGHVQVSGSVIIEEGAFIGAGVSIKPGRVIGKGSVVGVGAVVVKDVSEDAVVAGNPAMRNPKFKPMERWSWSNPQK